MKVYVGSDHAGYNTKGEIVKMLKENDYNVIECGKLEYDRLDDYNDAALELVECIKNDTDALGILVCGTGIGMSIAANRHRHIRAALCHTEYEAEITRAHNDANVLCLGERVIGVELAKNIVMKFLTSSFSNKESHVKRIERLTNGDN